MLFVLGPEMAVGLEPASATRRLFKKPGGKTSCSGGLKSTRSFGSALTIKYESLKAAVLKGGSSVRVPTRGERQRAKAQDIFARHQVCPRNRAASAGPVEAGAKHANSPSSSAHLERAHDTATNKADAKPDSSSRTAASSSSCSSSIPSLHKPLPTLPRARGAQQQAHRSPRAGRGEVSQLCERCAAKRGEEAGSSSSSPTTVVRVSASDDDKRIGPTIDAVDAAGRRYTLYPRTSFYRAVQRRRSSSSSSSSPVLEEPDDDDDGRAGAAQDKLSRSLRGAAGQLEPGALAERASSSSNSSYWKNPEGVILVYQGVEVDGRQVFYGSEINYLGSFYDDDEGSSGLGSPARAASLEGSQLVGAGGGGGLGMEDRWDAPHAVFAR